MFASSISIDDSAQAPRGHGTKQCTEGLSALSRPIFEFKFTMGSYSRLFCCAIKERLNHG